MVREKSASNEVTVLKLGSAPGTLSDHLGRLDWPQFEKLIAAIFEQQGYTVQGSGGARPDGGIDLFLNREGEIKAVQCKQLKVQSIGVEQIREFLGALTDSGMERGIFVALNDFSDEARALAERHCIRLVDDTELNLILEDLNWKENPAILTLLNNQEKTCPSYQRAA
jgi:restriction endonuclease Mrr